MELGIHSGIKDMYDALDQLTRISKHVPIHAVFGGKPDYRYALISIKQPIR